jgi:flagellar motility protein MotE (MotC chaperone)
MTKKAVRRAKRKFRTGTLFAISVLLIGSATLRIGLQAGPAIAREPIQEFEEAELPSDSSAQTTATSQELSALIMVLQKREQDLKLRERQFEDRMKALSIAENAIDDRLAALQSAEQALEATLSLADEASEGDLARLTDVYEKMKPKQASAMFEEMDPEFAAGFLSRMKPDVAASIMAGLDPITAYTISVVLAGRNASVPTE